MDNVKYLIPDMNCNDHLAIEKEFQKDFWSDYDKRTVEIFESIIKEEDVKKNSN